MKKLMAVYDADTRYAERLSDYVNRKEKGVFTAQAFTSKEKLAEYAKKHEIDVLLSGERTDSGDISGIPSAQKIYMSEETEKQMDSGKEIYKFQSGDDIIREVMAAYSEIPGIRPNTAGAMGQSRRIIGVYSPIGRCGKTCLALAIGQILAKEEKVLFVTLDTFTGFPLYFSSFLKENESEPSALRYEMEYLLAGKKSDRENLKDAVNQVLTLRGAMNLLFLLNSPDKKAEADALAAAVAVGIVPAQMALSFFILTLWAFGEAVLDVKMLLAGGKIPFWKTEGTWKTCLSGLLDQSFLKETGESSGDGRTYTEYLSCLILLMDRKTRNFRMMDLIQWNIRTEQADFSVANCAYQIEIEAEVLQKHMFFQKEEYKGTVYVAGSY